jgi:hypothetical protein
LFSSEQLGSFGTDCEDHGSQGGEVMKRVLIVVAISVLSLPVAGALQPAEAGIHWNAGFGFSVGGAYFSLGFDHHDRHGHYGAQRYVYRTSDRLRYRGYGCGSACYVRDRYTYHDRSCPLVGQHFRRYGFDPYSAWGYVDQGYRSYDRHYGRSHARPRGYYDRDYRSYRVPSRHSRGHSRHHRGCGH